MTTRAEEDQRLRQEQGDRFIKQMGEMFTQTRADMTAQFMPRLELETRLEHQEKADEALRDAIKQVAEAVEKLTGNVGNFQEGASRIFADRADTKADNAELRTEIEKVKTQLEGLKERGYDWRYSDAQGRMRGDIANERGWRGALQERSTQSFDRLWLAVLALIGLVSPLVSIIGLIITLATRK